MVVRARWIGASMHARTQVQVLVQAHEQQLAAAGSDRATDGETQGELAATCSASLGGGAPSHRWITHTRLVSLLVIHHY